MRSLRSILPLFTLFDLSQQIHSSNPSISVPHIQSSSPQEIPALQAVLTPLDSNSADKRAVATRAPHGFGARKASYDGQASLAQSARSLGDWEVENIVLLATVDGSLYSNDRNSGQQLWSFHSDIPMVQTIYHQEQDENNQWRWIVEPNQDGSLYIFSAGPNAVMQKLGPTVKELADHLSPWYSSDSQFVYTAEKRNSLLTLNASSGDAIKYFSPGESGFVGARSCRSVKRLDIEEENECEPTPTINLGRTDYTVSIQDRETSKKICTIKYFEWTPNVRDRDLQGQYSSTMDNKYIYSQYNGGVVAVEYKGQRVDNRFLYRSKFNSPVVRVFDVARPQGVDSKDISLVLLPQPTAPPATEDQGDKVFVNCTESGSWYALSEASYPSVTDGAGEAKCYSTISDDPRVYSDEKGFIPAYLIGVHHLDGQRQSPQRPLIGSPDIPSVSEAPTVHTKPTDSIPKLPWTIDPPRVETKGNSFYGVNTLIVALCAAILVLSKVPFSTKDLLGKKGIEAPNFKPLASEPSAVVKDARPRVHFAEPEDVKAGAERAVEITGEHVDIIDYAELARNQSASIDQAATSNLSGADVTKAEEIPNQKPIMNELHTREDSFDEKTDGSPEQEDSTRNTPKKTRVRGGRGGKRAAKQKAKAQGVANTTSQPNATIEAVAQTVAPKAQSIKPDNETPRVSNITDIDDGLVAVNDDRSLTYDPSKCLGQGAGGTLVYEGVYKKKVVAVKRMIRNYYEVDSQEVEALRQAELHKNIIRFYHEEKDQHFLYIVVEKCQADLHDLFGDRGFRNNQNELYNQLATNLLANIQDSLYQLIDGLNHLHHLRIIHRDIKPQNILVAYPKTASDNKLRLVISDFGLCRTLPENQSTYKPTAGGAGAGTTGWKAPELINQLKLDTEAQSASTGRGSAGSTEGGSQGIKRAADIFSMGCLFYYVLTQGHHPFDNPDDSEWWLINRDRNVKNNQVHFSKLEEMGADSQVACAMIRDMVSPNPAYRPSAGKVMGHPFFWQSHETLGFLCEVSDAFEQECRDPPSEPLVMLEQGASSVIPVNKLTGQLDFLDVLDKKFVATMAKRRGYKGDYVFDLLRALRNKKAHYDELTSDIQLLVGDIPDGYVKYWMDRFPKLLMHCYDTVVELGLDEQPRFTMYFAKRKS